MTNPYANRMQQIDDNRARAMQFMNSAHGQRACDGWYYTEMFNWAFHEYESGYIPDTVPTALLEGWKSLGEFRKQLARQQALRKK